MSGEEGETKPTKAAKLKEREELEQEKIKLCKEIGIWGTYEPIEGHTETAQYKKIEEIDKRLSEIING
jgi:hypothetical protein